MLDVAKTQEPISDEELAKSIDALIDEYLKNEPAPEPKKTESKEEVKKAEGPKLSKEDEKLLKEAKEAKEKEKASKEAESFKKSVQDIVREETRELKAAIEELTKTLRMPKGPRQAISKVQEVKKSFQTGSEEASKLTKSEVLNTMEELWNSGKISSDSLMAYETTSAIPNVKDREIVMKALKKE